jgi:hypothetical protein
MERQVVMCMQSAVRACAGNSNKREVSGAGVRTQDVGDGLSAAVEQLRLTGRTRAPDFVARACSMGSIRAEGRHMAR